MAGTIAGGLAAAATNKKKHGADFYAKLGAKGGRSGTAARGSVKGFAANRKLASEAGRIGGQKSRRNRR